jgi:Mn-containing catalase
VLVQAEIYSGVHRQGSRICTPCVDTGWKTGKISTANNYTLGQAQNWNSSFSEMETDIIVEEFVEAEKVHAMVSDTTPHSCLLCNQNTQQARKLTEGGLDQ